MLPVLLNAPGQEAFGRSMDSDYEQILQSCLSKYYIIEGALLVKYVSYEIQIHKVSANGF